MRRLETIIAGVLGEDASSINETTGPHSHESWDSLRHLHLMVALQEEYGISLSAREIRKMKTVAQIRELLKDKGAA